MIQAIGFDFYGVFTRDQVEEARESLADSAQLGAFETMLQAYFVGDASLSDLNKVLINGGSQLQISHHGERDLNHALLVLIKSLRSHGMKIAVVGDMGLDDAGWVWKENSSGALFDYLVPSSELRVAMPDRQLFDKLSERASTPAVSMIYVSARHEGVDGAAAAGVIGVHFTSTDRLAEVLAKLIADA